MMYQDRLGTNAHRKEKLKRKRAFLVLSPLPNNIVVSINACLSYSSPIGYTDGYGKVTDVWEHLNIGRMYGYDGTFYKSTTQGWMGNKCPTGERDETKRLAVLFSFCLSILMKFDGVPRQARA